MSQTRKLIREIAIKLYVADVNNAGLAPGYNTARRATNAIDEARTIVETLYEQRLLDDSKTQSPQGEPEVPRNLGV